MRLKQEELHKQQQQEAAMEHSRNVATAFQQRTQPKPGQHPALQGLG
jgi:hypothetical protein